MGARRWRIGAATLAVALGLVWLGGRAWPAGRLLVAPAIVVDRAFVEVADTVRRRETLSELFARHGIVGGELLRVVAKLDGVEPRRVRANTVFEFRKPLGDPLPDRIRVRVSDDAFVRVDRGADGTWATTSEAITWTVHTERVRGTINTSLYDAVGAVIPDSILPRASRDYLVEDLADGVFAWQIDFTRDFYPDDHFTVLYERLTSSLGEIRYGRILAAVMETRGRENTAYVLPDARGRNVYYDANAMSLRRAFKIYPVKFRRISSSFSRSRLHPVLGTRRAHLGIDFAADRGTPIEATGDGTVVRAGRWGTYGIMVAIRHPRGIETRYAHMSGIRAGIRAGLHVQQGDVIGYVGMTGLANGPHVHYEFLKNGRFLNPRGVDLGDQEPVPAGRREEFAAVRRRYDRFLGRSSTRGNRVD